MLVKYTGGRTHLKITLGRKSYCFTIENNRILDIKEQEVINHIFGLDNRSEFQVIVDEGSHGKPVVKEEVKEITPSVEVKKPGRPKKWSK